MFNKGDRVWIKSEYGKIAGVIFSEHKLRYFVRKQVLDVAAYQMYNETQLEPRVKYNSVDDLDGTT